MEAREIEAKRIAELLLEIKAVFLQPKEPFTWASGIKSPIYCDNRVILSYPDVRKEVEAALARLVLQRYPNCALLAGTSTAGIAHAALVAERLGLPMVYVRGSKKDHGRAQLIEGRAQPGQLAVVIEDLISTASSALGVVAVLRASAINVLGIACIFTYGLKSGLDAMAEADVANFSLLDYDTLIEVALTRNFISAGDVKALHAFRENPQSSDWQNFGISG
ncbi:MAG: orotate phosphoribosyltransferase [Oscillospiraceae bacterium]|jgi:orotate phosphoribosyltransferase|nr:orotate phosphoribosyltransferase [Oscillospiraceae bacterium]